MTSHSHAELAQQYDATDTDTNKPFGTVRSDAVRRNDENKQQRVRTLNIWILELLRETRLS
jgi:hypothetical protein